MLIKENHLKSIGSIETAVTAARDKYPDLLIQTEVETLDELEQALGAGATRILLDNFGINDVKRAVQLNTADGKIAELEVSGNIDLKTVRAYAQTGVDYISIGALTKNVAAVDLSMLFRID